MDEGVPFVATAARSWTRKTKTASGTVERDGTAQNFDCPASAHVAVRMAADAGAAELEGVLLAWQKAVTDGGKDRIRNQIAVELGSSDCAAKAVSKIDDDQPEGHGPVPALPVRGGRRRPCLD